MKLNSEYLARPVILQQPKKDYKNYFLLELESGKN